MVERKGNRVVAVESCALRLLPDAAWPFAVANTGAIGDYWNKRQSENPALFNGKIQLCCHREFRDRRFEAAFMPIDFAGFLYWREHGYPDLTAFDVFGSALVRTADGSILLGRAGAHTVNAGRVYLPGGFIDSRDVRADQSIDITASIVRELREETGIDDRQLTQEPGFLVVLAGQLISLVATFRSTKRRRELAGDVEAFIARDAAPELSEVVMAGKRSDLIDLAMPDYMHVLADHLFARRE